VRLEQTYTRADQRRYDYISQYDGFRAVLEYGDDGLIVDVLQDMVRPVAGMPWNSPWSVPRKLTADGDFVLGATRSSTCGGGRGTHVS
jgi:hypothetical protein